MSKPQMKRFRSRILNGLVLLREKMDKVSKPYFYCNVCDRQIRHPLDSPQHESDLFNKMQVVGAGFRPKEQCPLCLSNDRLRFSIEVMKRYTSIFTKECTVLEIAPIKGSGLMIAKQNPNAKYTSIDLVPGRAQFAMDATDMKFPNGSFDYIICHHVMEHIESEKAAIMEMKRVLKPDGAIILSMPICITMNSTYEDKMIRSDRDRLKYYGQCDHVRLYGLDAADRLRKHGLIVDEVVADETWTKDILQYGLIPNDRNFICTLPEKTVNRKKKK